MVRLLASSTTQAADPRLLTCGTLYPSQVKISERDSWAELKPGGKYYFTRNASSLLAFHLPKGYTSASPLALIATHVDSCALKVRPFLRRLLAVFRSVVPAWETRRQLAESARADLLTPPCLVPARSGLCPRMPARAGSGLRSRRTVVAYVRALLLRIKATPPNRLYCELER